MHLTDEHIHALGIASREQLSLRMCVFLGRFTGHEGMTLSDLRPCVDLAIELSDHWPSPTEGERTRLAHLLLCAGEQLNSETAATVLRVLDQRDDLSARLDLLERDLRGRHVNIRVVAP